MYKGRTARPARQRVFSGITEKFFSKPPPNSRARGCNPTPGDLFVVSLPLVATTGRCFVPVNSADSPSIFSDFP